MIRIGHGFDAHGFTAGRPLILGGVSLPHDKGLAAHSDGDAVLHALTDAILGAAALGDMGRYFPDTAEEFRNIDSRKLLKEAVLLISEKKYSVVNVDITILAQAPKIAPHIVEMCRNIASDLDVDTDAVNIKATTTESMGFIGREEGIAVYAVVLLEKK